MKKWRYFILLSLGTASFLLVGLKMYDLQIRKGSYYLAKAEARHQWYDFELSQRGVIYFTDKSGNDIPVAMNKDFPIVYAVPSEIEDASFTAKTLSEHFEQLNEGDLLNALSKQNDPYEPLLKKISGEEVEIVNGLGLDGVYVDTQNFRFYPFGSLGAHTLGFVGASGDSPYNEGRYGVELHEDGALLKAEDIFLTIDRNIQAQAEVILEELAEKYRAEQGTIIVQDPKSGAILALANYPTFDPNTYSEYEIGTFLNPAVQSLYEPGSVFKVLTIASGFDSEKLTKDTKLYDSGSLELNGYTIKNWDKKAYGNITIQDVIERSINTGAAQAEMKIGHDLFLKYLHKFGFNNKTDVDLPGEVAGNLQNLKTVRDINFATASFGQGVAVTPISLISAVSTIANDGVMMQPHVKRRSEGEVVNRIISKRAADEITDVMVSAVKKGYLGAIPNYDIAGKTGTAQIPGRGGYLEEYIHTFVGFAPTENPEFTALIKLDRPKDVVLAGHTVVPAFKELAQFIINYKHIAPTNIEIESNE